MKKISFWLTLIIWCMAINNCILKDSDCIYVSAVTLNTTALNLTVGGSETLIATVQPVEADNKAVTWISSNTNVATVTNEGLVLAVAEGTATITVNTVDGNKTAMCTVTVTVSTTTVAVTGITLNKNSTTLVVNSTEQLTPTINPANATNKSVTWSSSNNNIVSVDSNGIVTALAVGTATITVSTVDGNKTATCTVTVIIPTVAVTGVSIDKNNTTLAVGTTEQLTHTVLPANATNQSVSWSSSNNSIATVSNGGLVSAVATGTATITVSTMDGNKTATCTVTCVFILGTGRANDPFLISNAEQLAKIAELVNARTAPYANPSIYYRQIEDIDMSVITNWTPIGTFSDSFKGYYDGNGKTISNLKINATTSEQGLFGSIYAGEVKNLGLINVDIDGSSSVGGIAGYVESGRVANCYVTGAVSGSGGIGGVVGHANRTNIVECYTTCSVAGTTYVGGIVGIQEGGSIVSCYSTSTIIGNGVLGGLVGGYTIGIIRECAALNASLTFPYNGGNIGRVVGISGSGSSGLSCNVAFDGMVTSGFTVSSNAGRDVTAAQVLSAAFWTTTTIPYGATNPDWIGWDTHSWDFADGRLPILKNVGGNQLANNPPAHLQ